MPLAVHGAQENSFLALAGPHPQPFSQKGEGRKPMVGRGQLDPLQGPLLLIEGPWALPTAIEFHAFSVKTKPSLRAIVFRSPQLIRSGFLRLALDRLERENRVSTGGVINGS